MNRFGGDRLLGVELAVKGAVGEACLLGDRVDAGGINAVFAEQAGCGSQDSSAVLRRLLFRYRTKKTLLRVTDPLDSFDDDRHDSVLLDDERNQKHSGSPRRP